MAKRLHLGGFIRPIGMHTAWWRYPTANPEANFSWNAIKNIAQQLEYSCFDMIFAADHLAVMNLAPDALKRSGTISSFDPIILLPALAACTQRIGLIATASTSYEAPYHVARRFASLDHISGGRAGWNVVTTANPIAALNFGLDEAYSHSERYRRAKEFFEVVTGLWDSWADDALVMDKESGVFSDLDKIRPLKHIGEYYSVKGPLNIARPVQGWPVIAQAGSSDDGRQLAGEIGEVVFSNSATKETSARFYADVKERAVKSGRSHDNIKIMPANMIYVAETREDAIRKKQTMDSLIHIESGLPNLSNKMGIDLSRFDLDIPLPDLPETEQGKGNQQEWLKIARRENLTLRQLAQRAAESGYLEMIGSYKQVADQMEDWLSSNACDGFMILFHSMPEGLYDVTRLLVPELQRRGLVPKEYFGDTLRDHLGLERPPSRYQNYPSS